MGNSQDAQKLSPKSHQDRFFQYLNSIREKRKQDAGESIMTLG